MKSFIAYLLLAIVTTFPLIFILGDHLPGHEMDAYIYMWNVDEFWHNISTLQNPFFSNRVFYPLGSSLAFHTLAPLVAVGGLPFLNNLVLYMNLVVLTSLSLSAFSMNSLVKYLTKNQPAAFISGLLYGFSPIMVSYIVSQHYYFVVAAIFLPLAILFLLKYFQSHKQQYLIFFILNFWAAFFTDYQFTILLIAISGIVTVFHLNKLTKKIFLTLLLGIGIPLLLVFIFLFKIEAIKDRALAQENYYPAICSTHISGFILPSEYNPLLGEVTSIYKTTNDIPYNFDTPSYYLGWGILLLCVIWTWKYKKTKEIQIFATVGILILLFSLGPQTFVFRLFSQLPFMSLIDCPQRFPIGTQLALAGIVGIGLSKTKEKKKIGTLLLLVIGIITVEYGTVNIPTTKVEVPEVYRLLAEYKDNKTVLELPSGLTESKGAFGFDWSIPALNSKQLYWQTISNKPRVGGYLSRIPQSTYDYFKQEPLISDLFTMTSKDGEWTGNKFGDEEVNSFINKFNLGYIVLSTNERQDEFAGIVVNIFSDNIKQVEYVGNYRLYILK